MRLMAAIRVFSFQGQSSLSFFHKTDGTIEFCQCILPAPLKSSFLDLIRGDAAVSPSLVSILCDAPSGILGVLT